MQCNHSNKHSIAANQLLTLNVNPVDKWMRVNAGTINDSNKLYFHNVIDSWEHCNMELVIA